MPRTGRHPLKNKEIKDQPVVHQKVTVTTIVYIPMLAGYWQESLDVLKLFFESLYANTGQPFDLMVFDNGSCEEVKTHLLELQKNGKIQYLVFSQQNLRKLGALNYLLSAAPGEYIAYADSDVYFLPGWLDESLKVLVAFPEAGKVTALPMVGGNIGPIAQKTLITVKETPTIEVKTGLFVPEEYTESHRLGLGQSKAAFLERTKNRSDILISRNGQQALVSGADFEFVITKESVSQVLPLDSVRSDEYFDPIYSPVLENRLSALGFWQLSTIGYYVHHMGNTVPDLASELPWLAKARPEFFDEKEKPEQKNFYVKRFWANRYVREFLQHLHIWSYRILYEDK